MNKAGNLNNNFGAKNFNASNNAIKKQAAQKSNSPEVVINAQSMDILGAMGAAQVQMNKHMTNSVKISTDKFVKNPDGVEAYVDFCDSLVERGLCLEDAIEKTDSVFEILQNKETYQD